MKPRLLVLIGVLSVAAAVLLAAIADKNGDPAEAARLNNLGCAYMNQQLFEKALKSFEEAARRDPSLRVAKVNQGIALLSLARVDAARKILDEAAQADPKDPHVWYALGMLEKNSSNPEAAVQEFRRVTEIDDSDADTWYFLGSVYSQLKQFPQAIDAFEHALRRNRLHASAQFGLSRAFQQSGDSAHAREHLARFQYITQHKLGSAMSLAYGEQGKYSLAEESQAAAVKVPPQIAVRFIDVTDEAGLRPMPPKSSPTGSVPAQTNDGLGPGACFLDYDNDGKIDILLAASRADGGLSLYHNLGNRKLEEVTKQAGLDGYLGVLSCTVGDYDNDGFPDLALAVKGNVVLLHNEKNGTFKDVTSAAGISVEGGATGLTFIDYDHDGDLDLYVTRLSTAQTNVQGVEGTMWRNNGNSTFTDVTAETGLSGFPPAVGALGTDYNNDRAVDLAIAAFPPILFRNPREGKFEAVNPSPAADQKALASDGGSRGGPNLAILAADFDHDGWMDLVATGSGGPQLWHNNHGKSFEKRVLPETNWKTSYGAAAVDYDNDGWVDLVAVGETKAGKGEVRLFRNLGPDGFRDVTADVGLDRVQLKDPRAIITGDYDNDGATDLLITQHNGLAVLLKNAGGNKNNWLRLALKGLNDNKSAIGTKVEVFSDGIRQKFELYGSNGYLGQNSPYLTVGLGQAKQADVVRMLWPGGVLQDEIEVAGDRQQDFLELDRRGSSCPTLFAWNGRHFELVSDILGAGVIGHWVGPGERNIPRPVEWLKIDGRMIRQRSAVSPKSRETGKSVLSLRLLEPMEEVVYLDAVKLLAVDHPQAEQVYPNEYFASNPPYPDFKVITSRNAHPPAGAWDDKGNDLLSDLLAHKYIGRLDLLPFKGFTRPHSLILDLGAPYGGGPLRLLLHGEIEYFTATGMYAASQAGIQATAPYVEAEVPREGASSSGDWVRVTDDMGFPAGLPRTITVDLRKKVPRGAMRIRITTNLEIYWDNILIDRSEPSEDVRLTNVPLTRATLNYHGYSRQIEDQPPGNVKYVYEEVSGTGPYARQAGLYTRYGDVLPLLSDFDDRLVVFGSGDEVAVEFDPTKLPPIPPTWTRDYFFLASGYEKDMDFYAARGDTVEPLPFRRMGTYPSAKSFPSDQSHLDYLLEYNTRYVSGNEPGGYAFNFPAAAGRR
jgi:tetratricopeptide (TPR) repeat protein